ncbi:MAG: 50S ribosome-binding GTPase [Candidatus Lokiarchaeota archaeon]|nr:50S ribosome-binding GTPase [Candidatus Harpocratesius repetitus]
MKSPFEKFYRVWTAQELLDYAFSKASSKTASLPKMLPNLEKVKRKEIKRMENAVTILIEKLSLIIKSVPNLDELPAFYRKLSHLLVDNDELRNALGRINGVIPVLKRLFKQYRRKIGQQINPKQAGLSRTEFFGRCSSVVRQMDSTLHFLEECRVKLHDIPPVDLEIPSVVVAGYPNVGKSTLVGRLSSAKPQVSEYPFTTKQIYLGSYRDEYDSKFFQVIDTPGILDRPMSQRNTIEKQAILALNTIASIILFVFDPTPSSGYEVSKQINLYHEIRENFADDFEIPLKIVINKIDLASDSEIQDLLSQLQLSESEVTFINAKDGKNVEDLINYLLEFMKEQLHP